MEIRSLLQEYAPDGLITLSGEKEIARETGLSLHQVEEICLQRGIMPARYQRNMNTLEVADQYTLFRSRVGVAGCGGLGGYVVEELARLGVGTITVWDFDTFTEHNLNRQLFSNVGLMGKNKVEAAEQRVASINPAVSLIGRVFRVEEDAESELQNQQVVVDALDNIPSRLVLAERCRRAGVVLIHGAIGAWYGQVLTQFPGDHALEMIYGTANPEQGLEKEMGNPAFIPAVVASLQVAEVVKVLLGKGPTLRRKMLVVDLYEMTMETIDLADSSGD